MSKVTRSSTKISHHKSRHRKVRPPTNSLATHLTETLFSLAQQSKQYLYQEYTEQLDRWFQALIVPANQTTPSTDEREVRQSVDCRTISLIGSIIQSVPGIHHDLVLVGPYLHSLLNPQIAVPKHLDLCLKPEGNRHNILTMLDTIQERIPLTYEKVTPDLPVYPGVIDSETSCYRVKVEGVETEIVVWPDCFLSESPYYVNRLEMDLVNSRLSVSGGDAFHLSRALMECQKQQTAPIRQLSSVGNQLDLSKGNFCDSRVNCMVSVIEGYQLRKNGFRVKGPYVPVNEQPYYCSIQLDTVTNSVRLGCGHQFGIDNLFRHISQTGPNATVCPLCRQNIILPVQCDSNPTGRSLITSKQTESLDDFHQMSVRVSSLLMPNDIDSEYGSDVDSDM